MITKTVLFLCRLGNCKFCLNERGYSQFFLRQKLSNLAPTVHVREMPGLWKVCLNQVMARRDQYMPGCLPYKGIRLTEVSAKKMLTYPLPQAKAT